MLHCLLLIQLHIQPSAFCLLPLCQTLFWIGEVKGAKQLAVDKGLPVRLSLSPSV